MNVPPPTTSTTPAKPVSPAQTHNAASGIPGLTTAIHTSIRTRLLIVYLGLLLVGFAALTAVAGSQIAEAARGDYEQRLLNEAQLIRQGLNELFFPRYGERNQVPADVFTALIDEYETQLNGTIVTYGLNVSGSTDSDSPRSFRDAPEIETAMRNGIIVVEREDAQGRPALYTAVMFGAPDGEPSGDPGDNDRDNPPPANTDGQQSPREGGYPFAIVQISVPLDNLQALIWQRWALLLTVFVAVLIVTAAAALLTARSIIRPLYQLRQAAMRLSHGDLDYRVASPGTDEIGEVGHAFNLMAKRVQNMVEEQRAYASNASHELRTPLTTIRLRSEALRYDDGLEPDFAKQYIREIDEEAQRMSGLIDDLTLLSRFDAGRAERGHDQIDLYQFSSSLAGRFRQQSQTNHLTLTLDLPEGLPPISASLNHLTVVFRNLIENSMKYTPPGGTITWQMRPEKGGVMHIIQDTGHGIDPEHLPHLFERFYRADKARSRDIPGYGLGLAIVKSVIEMYGGSITVASAGKDRGTTVTVFLPTGGTAGATGA